MDWFGGWTVLYPHMLLTFSINSMDDKYKRRDLMDTWDIGRNQNQQMEQFGWKWICSKRPGSLQVVWGKCYKNCSTTCEKPFSLKAAKTSNKEWTTHQSIPQATLWRTQREVPAGPVFGEPAEIIRERDTKIRNDTGEGIHQQVPSKSNQKIQIHQNQAIWAKHPGTNKKNLNMAKLAKQSSRKKMKSCIGTKVKEFKET